MGAFGKKPAAPITPFGKMGIGAFGKKALPGMDSGNKEDHGLLEGISSLHSWIKSQTMMKPTTKMRGKHEQIYDMVHSCFT